MSDVPDVPQDGDVIDCYNCGRGMVYPNQTGWTDVCDVCNLEWPRTGVEK